MSDQRSAPIALTDHRVIAVRGPDARKFLQGQLSQDVLTLSVGEVRHASLNNAQGRCVVLLDVLAETDTDLLCITTGAQASTLLETLKRYVLRSKLTLTDDSAHYRLTGLWSTPSPANSSAEILWSHGSDGRCIGLRRVDTAAAAEPASPVSSLTEPADASAHASARAAWSRADIAAGLPQLEPATQGEFVAQMLNLDVLEAISFKKGCYTGQEVIARAHFRGRVKRRLQRFRLALLAHETLTPGQSITLSDGRSASVVNAMREQDFARPGAPNHAEATATEPVVWQCLAVTTFDGPALPEALALPYALPQP